MHGKRGSWDSQEHFAISRQDGHFPGGDLVTIKLFQAWPGAGGRLSRRGLGIVTHAPHFQVTAGKKFPFRASLLEMLAGGRLFPGASRDELNPPCCTVVMGGGRGERGKGLRRRLSLLYAPRAERRTTSDQSE